MTMTLDDYRERAKSNELYNSWLKLCKDRLENAIKEGSTSCDIELSSSNNSGTSISAFEAEVLDTLVSSISMVYNCDTTTEFNNNGYITVKVNWGDNVIPYRKEAN